MGPPPGSGNYRPTMSEREQYRRQRQQEQAAEKAQQVRQKKSVREGDVFKVVGTLQDSVSGEAIPYVNLAVLSAEDSTMVKGGITDIIDDGVTGLIARKRDPADLAEKIGALLEDASLRRQMGAAAREKYDGLFTLEKFERRFTDCLHALLE